MKQSKGFSLIELLAVIVILAIVAVITTPLVLNTINDVKKRSFTSTAYGIIKAAEMEYTNQMIKGNNNETIFTYENGKEEANRTETSLKYKGERPKNGTVIINSEGKIAIAIHNGTFCSEKSFEESVVITSNKTKEECVINYDLSKNLFTKTFGGSDYEDFYGFTTTSDGYVAVGFSYSNDYDLEGLNKGESDAIIVKYDLNGNVIWKKTFGGSNFDLFAGVM
ncbi:MAG: type II secretion system protein, partial [Mollicutes bacterium]|nr:type II secretion system protein [Mollicutes bacterium]